MDTGFVQATGQVVVLGQFDFFVKAVDSVKHRFFEDNRPAGNQGLGSVLGDIHTDIGECSDKPFGIAVGVRLHPGSEKLTRRADFCDVVVDFA